jgi:hypothetical protein
MASLDPKKLVVNPAARPFTDTQRVELASADLRTNNERIVYRKAAKSNEVLVVRYIVPYAQERTDVGTPSESFRMISPVNGDGHFGFSPYLANGPAFTLESSLNAPSDAANPQNNDQLKGGVIPFISNNPWIDVMRFNPMFAIVVNAEVEFTVTFQLLRAAIANGIPNVYQINAGIKRVDFAGCVVSGITIPQPVYNRILQEQQQ